MTRASDSSSIAWEYVWRVQLGSIIQTVNPKRCSIYSVRVTLMGTTSIPLDLAVFPWNPHVDSNAWQGPEVVRYEQTAL